MIDEKDGRLAFLFFRFAMGFNMFLHGALRLWGGTDKFVDGVTERLALTDPALPQGLTRIMAWAITPWEFIVGVLLMLGLFTRSATIALIVLMLMLMFGTSLEKEWDDVFTQLSYAMFAFFLLLYRVYNHYSLDRYLFKKPSPAV